MFFPCSVFLIPFFFLIGCGSDPILEKAAALQQENSSASKGGTGQKIEPKPGIPKEPQPVVVQPQIVQPPKPQVEEKPKIQISGSVDIVGEGDWKGKAIRIDVFDGDQQVLGEPRPKVIATKRIQEVGSFSLMVEKEVGSLWLGAYCDVDGDGRPGPKDPSGWYGKNPVSSAVDLEGIVISLAIPIEENPSQEEKK